MMWLSWWSILIVLYFFMCWLSVKQAASPTRPCPPVVNNNNNNKQGGDSCIYPLIQPGDEISMELLLLDHSENSSSTSSGIGKEISKWKKVESCQIVFQIPVSWTTSWFSNTLPMELTKDQNCTVPLPDFARHRWSKDAPAPRRRQELQAAFVFHNRQGQVIAKEGFLLTRIVDRSKTFLFQDASSSSSSSPRKLLEQQSQEDNNSHNVDDDYPNATMIPHYKYARQPLVLRLVMEDRAFGRPYQRQDGIGLTVHPKNRSAYQPRIYVDDNALQYQSHNEMAPPSSNKPPARLSLELAFVSPMADVLHTHLKLGLEMAQDTLLLSHYEMDEFRYWLREKRLFRFFLTQVISMIHLVLEYMAFADEISFYRGKKDLRGLSVSTVTTRFVCSTIIFLYLLDGGATSWIVLLGIFSDITIEAWKLTKMFQPTYSTSFPFIHLRKLSTLHEKKTQEYDRIAYRYLSYVLYPIVAAWSLYALQHYHYKSWWSWLISNLANAVYTFGFIALCPQLYINYRLKSVAHMPWKVYMYKIFNTFVDDIFAFLVEMPWKHRIMTLRDDVVFFIFLAQAYYYRVDKSRTNEYGYAYSQTEKTEKVAAALNDKKDTLPENSHTSAFPNDENNEDHGPSCVAPSDPNGTKTKTE